MFCGPLCDHEYPGRFLRDPVPVVDRLGAHATMEEVLEEIRERWKSPMPKVDRTGRRGWKVVGTLNTVIEIFPTPPTHLIGIAIS
jgi:hypothetical protein